MHDNDTIAKIEARNAEARTIMVRYTGHVGSGGLQGHSVGALYPYTVYGQETPSGTRYGVLNTCGGWDTGPRYLNATDATLVAEFNASIKHERLDETERLAPDFGALVERYSERPSC